MISLESHSKQIKLLNDYIGALEKQTNSSKQEVQELQKLLNTHSMEASSINEALNRERNENAQLKFHLQKCEEELRRFTGLSKEYQLIREQLDRERAERKAVETEFRKKTEHVQRADQHIRELEEQVANKNHSIDDLIHRYRSELEEVKKTAINKEQELLDALNL